MALDRRGALGSAASRTACSRSGGSFHPLAHPPAWPDFVFAALTEHQKKNSLGWNFFLQNGPTQEVAISLSICLFFRVAPTVIVTPTMPLSGAMMTYDNNDPETFTGDVAHILADVRRHFENAHWHLSNALETIRNRYTKVGNISESQRDVVLNELFGVRALLPLLFPLPRDLGQAEKGIEAGATMVMMLADPPRKRAARPAYLLGDCQRAARILQNLCHNVCLEQELRGNAARRASEAVQAIQRAAIRGAAA